MSPSMCSLRCRLTASRGLRISSVSLHANKPFSTRNEMHDPKKINTDLIGPADPISNLRPVVFKVSDRESVLEKKLRIQREEVQKWNQKFWWHHNNNFYQQKQEFIQKSTKSKKSCSNEKNALTSEEMSTFYKDFLDKNWENHLKYNVEWYRKNFGILFLSYRVKWDSIVRKVLPLKNHD